MLSGYFRSGGGSETGGGHASPRLLSHFANTSLTVAGGLSNSDALAAFRQDVCQLSDAGLSAAQKLRFVHQLMSRDMAEVRLFLDRIETYVASVSETERRVPEIARTLAAIADDQDARIRYLEFARDADQPAVWARMIKLASRLGWLSEGEERAEFVRLINDRLAKNTASPADVDLICVLNEDHGLDQEIDRLQPLPAQAQTVARAAIVACLGSSEARAGVLLALTSPDKQEAQIAQVYLRRRPITDVDELRDLTSRVAYTNDSAAQVRVLDTLAGQDVSDPASLEELARLFVVAQSPEVQASIASILIRSDYQAIATVAVAQELRQSSLTSPGRSGSVDILLRRLPGG
jgi:hypothetical protein